MEHERAAKYFSDLGNGTRLSIYRYLVRAGRKGAPVGQIQEALQAPNSTLSHHIGRLVEGGLVRQVRDSRKLYCTPEYEVLDELVAFLKSECCLG